MFLKITKWCWSLTAMRSMAIRRQRTLTVKTTINLMHMSKSRKLDRRHEAVVAYKASNGVPASSYQFQLPRSFQCVVCPCDRGDRRA